MASDYARICRSTVPPTILVSLHTCYRGYALLLLASVHIVLVASPGLVCVRPVHRWCLQLAIGHPCSTNQNSEMLGQPVKDMLKWSDLDRQTSITSGVVVHSTAITCKSSAAGQVTTSTCYAYTSNGSFDVRNMIGHMCSLPFNSQELQGPLSVCLQGFASSISC